LEPRDTEIPQAAPSGAVFGRPPHLDHADLVRAQAETLAAPRRDYGILARILFTTLDTLYGKKRTLSKFKVLELVARVPYQTWEQVAYIAITHMHNRTQLARRIYDRVRESREQQDNEQWHLLILEEQIARSGKRENRIYYFWIPQAIALVYYHISWLLFVVHPAWSYRLNADFEDHAEHEYMHLVTEHPEWESTPFQSDFADDYGPFDSVADLYRQIGHDERVHKEESIIALARPRFG
jgi:hypothetical protein